MILAIDTSCDETSAAVTDGRRVLSNVISSQIQIHKKYGGVYPALAKRAHQERIDFVVNEALRRAEKNLEYSNSSPASHLSLLTYHLPISAIAVTQGPGLAIALEVGIKKAKEIINEAMKQSNNHLPLIAVNHLEGHIYSCLALPAKQKTEDGKQTADKQIANSDLSVNSAISPLSSILCFPGLCLIVSGGHTELVLMKDHGNYEVIGATLDDACGEALDKAAKILRLGYPGGPIIEKLSEQFFSSSKFKVQSSKFLFNQPLKEKSNLNFSYSGLKTQLLYLVQKMSDEQLGKNLLPLAFSFQEACFEQIIRKTSDAIEMYQPKTLLCGGGVIANKYLRKLLRRMAKEKALPVLFPPSKNLITDNAAMIGVAAWYKFQRKEFVKDIEGLDREPRLSLVSSIKY
ncbi:MAG: tRNA (adenosine(37)-N6)-threonylcarbamoyltransferase complex transferase subunit TsaD [Microgenomates group bacterium]